MAIAEVEETQLKPGGDGETSIPHYGYLLLLHPPLRLSTAPPSPTTVIYSVDNGR